MAGLIVFARYPRPGEVKTRLGASIGHEAAAAAYRSMAAHAFAVAEEVAMGGVTVYLSYAPGAGEDEVRSWVGREFHFLVQEGEDLGGRMYHAFRHLFSSQSGPAVIIGTDVPALTAEIVQTAFAHLQTHDLVIGPSRDGGYYLLGMRSLHPRLFLEINWGSPTVLQKTMERAAELGLRSVHLEALDDIDTSEDYAAYLRLRSGGSRTPDSHPSTPHDPPITGG